MPQDYFSVLGLSPGRYPESVITDRYRHLCATTDDRQRRERGLIAYWTLKDPAKQFRYLRRHMGAGQATERKTDNSESKDKSDQSALRQSLTLRVHDQMDGPLLRWSARQALLDEAEAMGLSRFLALLTIAEAIHSVRTTGPMEGTRQSHLARPQRRKKSRRMRRWLTVAIVIGSTEALLLWWLFVGP